MTTILYAMGQFEVVNNRGETHYCVACDDPESEYDMTPWYVCTYDGKRITQVSRRYFYRGWAQRALDNLYNELSKHSDYIVRR